MNGDHGIQDALPQRRTLLYAVVKKKCRDSSNSSRKTMWFHEQNSGFRRLKRGLGKLPILLSMVIHQ